MIRAATTLTQLAVKKQKRIPSVDLEELTERAKKTVGINFAPIAKNINAFVGLSIPKDMLECPFEATLLCPDRLDKYIDTISKHETLRMLHIALQETLCTVVQVLPDHMAPYGLWNMMDSVYHWQVDVLIPPILLEDHFGIMWHTINDDSIKPISEMYSLLWKGLGINMIEVTCVHENSWINSNDEFVAQARLSGLRVKFRGLLPGQTKGIHASVDFPSMAMDNLYVETLTLKPFSQRILRQYDEYKAKLDQMELQRKTETEAELVHRVIQQKLLACEPRNTLQFLMLTVLIAQEQRLDYIYSHTATHLGPGYSGFHYDHMPDYDPRNIDFYLRFMLDLNFTTAVHLFLGPYYRTDIAEDEELVREDWNQFWVMTLPQQIQNNHPSGVEPVSAWMERYTPVGPIIRLQHSMLDVQNTVYQEAKWHHILQSRLGIIHCNDDKLKRFNACLDLLESISTQQNRAFLFKPEDYVQAISFQKKVVPEFKLPSLTTYNRTLEIHSFARDIQLIGTVLPGSLNSYAPEGFNMTKLKHLSLAYTNDSKLYVPPHLMRWDDLQTQELSLFVRVDSALEETEPAMFDEPTQWHTHIGRWLAANANVFDEAQAAEDIHLQDQSNFVELVEGWNFGVKVHDIYTLDLADADDEASSEATEPDSLFTMFA